MPIIIVKTQAELDALPTRFDEHTIIEIHGSPQCSRISVVARDNSSVVAWGNSRVVAWGNSSVVAMDNSSVEAMDNSRVVAWRNSSVVAWGNSSVVARGNSSVEARGNSSVEARDNSSVEARDNSSVVARDNSSVEARDNSSVEAMGNVAVRIYGDGLVLLYSFAVAWLFSKTNPKKKSKTCTVIIPKPISTTADWVLNEVAEHTETHAVVYKRVSSDWKTQENTPYETAWRVGSTLSHPDYRPKDEECGYNKFHACSRPYFCDEFRSKKGDRYIAIRVPRKSLHFWGAGAAYPHKVAFGRGEVLYECDRMGRKIESK